MRLQNEFTVAAPIDRTWATLLDVAQVGGCLPGAEMEPGDGDGVYRGRMRLKLGPMTVAYEGSARMLEVDEDARTSVMEVRAREATGGGSAAATIRNAVESLGEDRTRVRVETDLQVTGRQAQFGRAIMEDVAQRMLGQFAERLEALVAGGQTAVAGPAPSAAQSEPASTPSEPEALDVGDVLGRELARKAGLAGAAGLALFALFLGLRRAFRRGLSIRIDLGI